MPYEHETFMQDVGLTMANIVETSRDSPDASIAMSFAGLATLVFSLGHAINENLNRLAVAQEAQLELQTRDFDEFVKQKISEGVEIKLAEKPKRDYIGK